MAETSTITADAALDEERERRSLPRIGLVLTAILLWQAARPARRRQARAAA